MKILLCFLILVIICFFFPYVIQTVALLKAITHQLKQNKTRQRQSESRDRLHSTSAKRDGYSTIRLHQLRHSCGDGCNKIRFTLLIKLINIVTPIIT